MSSGNGWKCIIYEQLVVINDSMYIKYFCGGGERCKIMRYGEGVIKLIVFGYSFKSLHCFNPVFLGV